MIERKHISLAGISTAFLDVGSGRTVVALHGVPTSSTLFEPLVPFLAGCRVIVPDLLGQGDTEAPAAGPLDYAAYRNHLQSFLATVPPRDVSLVLHDLGAILGLEWAAAHPERVRGIVILSTTVTWSLRVDLIQIANLLFGPALLRYGMGWTLKSSRQVDPSIVQNWSVPWTRRRLLRGWDLFAPAHLRRLRAQLGDIHAPVLLVWGAEDDIFPPSHAARIIEALPHARLVTIPRCGHWSMLDAPEEVSRHIVDFLHADDVRRHP